MRVARSIAAVLRTARPALWLAVLAVALSQTAGTAFQSQSPSAYTLYQPGGRRSALPARIVSGVEVVSLDQLATIFGLTVAEDVGVGGLTVRGRGQTILLIPGQSFASVGPGKIISLSGPVQRDRNAWLVPIDFIRQALSPALSVPIEVRRTSRIIVVGDVRVPQITGRVERQGTGVRITIDAQPSAPHRVTRDNNRLLVRYDAVAIDAAPIGGLVPELARATRIEGTTLVIELGPQAVTFRADDRSETQLVIELMTAPSPPPPSPLPATPPPPSAQPPSAAVPGQPAAAIPPIPPSAGTAARPGAQEPSTVDITVPGAIRTVVIDPGHGGDDLGSHGPGGTKEKDYVLQLARKLKAAIEGRYGLRVLLTRDGDEVVPIDRRTSLANNSKADLFISLHANAAVRPAVRGAQVISLGAGAYKEAGADGTAQELPVPVVSGGTRRIDLVPWDLAQMPFVDRSAAIAGILVRQLAEKGVPLYGKPAAQLPMRVLVGANMPAILLEVGFLTSPEEEAALGRADRSNALIEALVATIGEVRRGIAGMPARTP